PEPVARAVPGRETVDARPSRIGDAGPAVHGDGVDGRAGACADDDLAAAGVADQVGGELGDDDRHLAALALVEAEPGRQRLRPPPRRRDAAALVDAQPCRDAHRHVTTRTTVPAPGCVVTSNSPTRRRAPPKPRPRPVPVL